MCLQSSTQYNRWSVVVHFIVFDVGLGVNHGNSWAGGTLRLVHVGYVLIYVVFGHFIFRVFTFDAEHTSSVENDVSGSKKACLAIIIILLIILIDNFLLQLTSFHLIKYILRNIFRRILYKKRSCYSRILRRNESSWLHWNWI